VLCRGRKKIKTKEKRSFRPPWQTRKQANSVEDHQPCKKKKGGGGKREKINKNTEVMGVIGGFLPSKQGPGTDSFAIGGQTLEKKKARKMKRRRTQD